MRHVVNYIVPAVRLNPGAGDQPGRKASRFCFPGEGLSFFLQVHHFVTFTDHLRQCGVVVDDEDAFLHGGQSAIWRGHMVRTGLHGG